MTLSQPLRRATLALITGFTLLGGHTALQAQDIKERNLRFASPRTIRSARARRRSPTSSRRSAAAR